jgi:uncharacterized protein (DUF4415 family)
MVQIIEQSRGLPTEGSSEVGKDLVTIQSDVDVVAASCASGGEWQRRNNDELRAFVFVSGSIGQVRGLSPSNTTCPS